MAGCPARLRHPNGTDTRYPDLIFSRFGGWWVGIEDGRVDRLVVSEEEWDARLRQRGFHGIQSSVRDNKDADFFNVSNIMACARSINTSESEDTSMRITLVNSSAKLGDFGQGVKSSLETAGYTLDDYIWEPSCQMVKTLSR